MNGASDEELLIRLAAEVGVEVPRERAAKLLLLRELILSEPKRTGLTSIRDPTEFLEKHLVDCLTCLPCMNPQANERVLDIGSGAGLPGLVLAVMRPDWRVVCLEASLRKVEFLRRARAAVGAAAEVLHGRAEELARQQEHRERYDAVVARAVAPLAVLLELALPFCRLGGRLVAMKGPRAREELAAGRRALDVLGGEVAEVRRLRLPLSGAERQLVLVEKVRPTPERYPRRAGVLQRRPLG